MGAAPQAPTPPKFIPTDIASTAALAEKFNTIGYNMSDADFLARFPGLVAMRDKQIASDVKDATGPLDPTLENSFATSSLGDTLNAFGGPTGSIGEEGSAARGAIASGIANKTQSFQDQARLNVQSDIQANPERQFAIAGEDAVNLLIGNILGGNQSRFAGYTGGVANANAQNQATTQNAAAAASIAISIIGIAL